MIHKEFNTLAGLINCFFIQNIFSYSTLCFFFQLVSNALLPEVLKNLFDQCCVKNPKNRPLMSNVVKALSVSR